MNKFRILTTDNEWVYTTINVLEDRIGCPLLNAQGAQFLKPNIKFKGDTLGKTPGVYDKTKRLMYEGDIIEWERLTAPERYLIHWSTSALTWELYTPDLPYSDDYIMDLGDFANEGDTLKCFTIIGNIHQNPELTGNSGQLGES